MRRARAWGWLGLAGVCVIGCVTAGGGAPPKALTDKAGAATEASSGRPEENDVPLVPLPPLPRAPGEAAPPKAPLPTRADPPAPAPDDKPAPPVTARELY